MKKVNETDGENEKQESRENGDEVKSHEKKLRLSI